MLTKISDDIFSNDIPAKYSPSEYMACNEATFKNFKVKLNELIKGYQNTYNDVTSSEKVPVAPKKLQEISSKIAGNTAEKNNTTLDLSQASKNTRNNTGQTTGLNLVIKF